MISLPDFSLTRRNVSAAVRRFVFFKLTTKNYASYLIG